MKKRIVILGAGYVVAPCVEYLLRRPENHIIVAAQFLKEAQDLAKDFTGVDAVEIDATNQEQLTSLIQQSDLVISLVPYVLHPLIARVCIVAKVPLVTASYVSDEMRALDDAAKAAGVLLLNEIGLDPGIDHLSTMQVIDQVKQSGGQIKSFASWCGGLPSPAFNDNPLGYKFSWAPRSVLLALLNHARFLKDHQRVDVEGNQLLDSAKPIDVTPDLLLEGYPNRDATLYHHLYGLKDASNLIRGTLRYQGFCDIFAVIQSLGLLSLETEGIPHFDTWQQWYDSVLLPEADQIPTRVIEALQWLGFNSDITMPNNLSRLDALCELLAQRLIYKDNETDMVVLQHRFEIQDQASDKTHWLTSRLVAMGDPGGYSAMAKTVGYPVAMATQLILDKEIDDVGVHIPVRSVYYSKMLPLLEQEGICFEETESTDAVEPFFVF